MIDRFATENPNEETSLRQKEARGVKFQAMKSFSLYNTDEILDNSSISVDSIQSEDIPDELKSNKAHTKIIRITRAFRTRWDLFTMFLAIYNCFQIPIIVAFSPEEHLIVLIFNLFTDLMFILDIGFNFRTSYIDEMGEEITDLKMIAKNYLRGDFVFDLLASLPIDQMYLLFESDSSQETANVFRFSDLLKLIRILRLGRIIRSTRTREDVKATIKLLQLLLYLVMWMHLTGCFWYIIVKQDEKWIPVPDFGLQSTTLYDEDLLRQYFVSFYHSVWLLVGGEIGPRDQQQAAIASILILIGALISAVLFGEMAVLMTNVRRRATNFQEMLDRALTTMSEMKLPKLIQNDVLNFLTQIHGALSMQSEYEMFQSYISPSLQTKVNGYIYERMISENPVIKRNFRVIQALMHRLNNNFAKPESEVLRQGEISRSMYFIVNGSCLPMVQDTRLRCQRQKVLEVGNHFGEISMLYDIPRTATIIALGYCTLAELTLENFLIVVDKTPSFAMQLRKYATKYDDQFKIDIIEQLKRTSYFNKLPRNVLKELPYIMKPLSIKRNGYLYRPGAESRYMYIVIEGCFEVSMTINEKHLHLLKKYYQIQNIEGSPRIHRQYDTIDDFYEFNFDITDLTALKSYARVIPIINDKRIVGFTQKMSDIPMNNQPIGDYPQEIVLCEIGPLTLVHTRFAIFDNQHQMQCRALQNSIVYILDKHVIKQMQREFTEFNDEIVQLKWEDKNQRSDYFKTLDLDFIYPTHDKKYSFIWKQAITKVIVQRRRQVKIGVLQLQKAVRKLKAIIACEQAGNIELSLKVQKDEIDYNYIRSDGTVDPTINDHGPNSRLPEGHPVMETFTDVFKTIMDRNGEFKQNFYKLSQQMRTESRKFTELQAQVESLTQIVDQLIQKKKNKRQQKQLEISNIPPESIQYEEAIDFK